MRILPLLLAALTFATPVLAEDNKFTFDKSHTRILFFISHMGFSETVGDFTVYDGSFVFDEKDPTKSSVEVTLKPEGIRTPSPELDKHLQNQDFFNSAKFPDITFKSKEIKVTGKNTGEALGDLTMLGVTKPVTLRITFNKADYHMMTGEYVAGFSAEAVVKRSEFGMNYGIPMIGDDVRLIVHTEGVNASRKKPISPEQQKK
ncbi:MAG: YceI family protein [Alphaproteobacteria bacterium]